MSTRAPHLGPARRRELVLDAAVAVFADSGYERASMAAVAARAGVAKAVLYDCFPGGKDELWAALLHRLERAFTDHLDGVKAAVRAAAPDRVLGTGLRSFLNYAEVDPAGFAIVFGEMGAATPEIRRGRERMREQFVAFVRAEVVGRLALPASAEIGAELFARVVVAIAEELARWTLRRPDLPRGLLVALAGAWLHQGVPAGTAAVVQGHDHGVRGSDRQPGPSTAAPG